MLAGDRESADSLLRTSCKKMLGQADALQPGSAFDIWAFGQLHAQWLTVLRSHELPIAQGQADASVFLPAGDVEGYDHSEEIAGILSKLPPQQRSAVLLVYGEGFSYEEVTRILDTPIDTVLARLSRALASFVEKAHWLESSETGSGKVAQLNQMNRQAG